MRHTILALLVGIIIGIVTTLTTTQIAGSWWEYRILEDRVCHLGHDLGVDDVAPNQPNPCLIRHPRWLLFT